MLPHREVLGTEERGDRGSIGTAGESRGYQMDPLNVMHQTKDSYGSIGRAAVDPTLVMEEERNRTCVPGDLMKGLSCVQITYEHSTITTREESVADHCHGFDLIKVKDVERPLREIGGALTLT
jgi:hypothetical protein